ncbi:metalloregulator ArsR/SmtB family transcription factor [Cohnella sp. REN36]|uniref:ArsR/SmtB family transcription factor n=1 Tax=Cohnella sp. REN36 TaxID=2887347 RepID=UPI001D133045|nr:metalloregulator ArsR/SmtB family transcription factor [Cohnella sp. REN36]MCC3373632.1 metalloregulator ArsR/SmtB family transcription factor [Cohnella sp. REN36]
MKQELPVRDFKDGVYRQFARIGKCLSSDKRLELMDLLSQGPKSVEKMAEATGMSVANVSRHLQIMLDANLVKFNKKGTYVIYSLASPIIEGFLNSLWRICEMQLGDVTRIKNDFLSQFEDLQTLSMDEVLSKMEEGSIILLDVRPADEYEAGHIPGAISVPMEELHHCMDRLPKGIQIAAYCRGPYCVYAAEAVETLRREGFTAFHMEEGVFEWRAYQTQRS